MFRILLPIPICLWSIFRSPLIIGGELPSLDPLSLALLANPEVIAVDQSSGAGHESFRNGAFVAWTADAPDHNTHYIAVFNVTDVQQAFEADWSASWAMKSGLVEFPRVGSRQWPR